jgi:aarF domain-containing kinase
MYVPFSYDAYTSKRVLTMEFIDNALKIDEVATLELMYGKEGVKEIPNSLIHIFGKMIFEHGHIHADAHPGNILIRPNPSSPEHP